jgi:hypothetical protein
MLKTQGYHLEPKYSHGQQHLVTVLERPILLDFLSCSILDSCDTLYRRVRRRLPSRRTFFERLRNLTVTDARIELRAIGCDATQNWLSVGSKEPGLLREVGAYDGDVGKLGLAEQMHGHALAA